MNEQALPGPSLNDVRLDELDDGQWRVSDRRFRATNARMLLGFIRQVAERFEVTLNSRPDEPVQYETLAAAAAAFVPVARPSRAAYERLDS